MELADRIAALDVGLLEEIESQTTLDDRRSLLSLHAACRALYGSFEYLEIGSHLGGSIQALIRDPACTRIVSIDARPRFQPDARGVEFEYPDNSTARMVAGLARLDSADITKLDAIDASTTELRSDDVDAAPVLCFIDGEHTNEAVLRDARFCREVLAGSGTIAFHDAWIVHRGIQAFLAETFEAGIYQRPYLLPDSILVVELGSPRLLDVAQVTQQVQDGYRGYLWSLEQASRSLRHSA